MSKKKQTGNSEADSPRVKIWLVIIPGLVAIILALFTFPPFQRLFEPKPTPTPLTTNDREPTLAVSAATATHTSTPDPLLVETFIPESSITATATLSTSSGVMYVILTANRTSGRASLTVKLDARTSYLRAPDGKIFDCSKGACIFTWYVYFNGVQFTEPLETRGNVDFKFDKRGTYFVSVYICHGAEHPICASGGTVIIVE